MSAYCVVVVVVVVVVFLEGTCICRLHRNISSQKCKAGRSTTGVDGESFVFQFVFLRKAFLFAPSIASPAKLDGRITSKLESVQVKKKYAFYLSNCSLLCMLQLQLVWNGIYEKTPNCSPCLGPPEQTKPFQLQHRDQERTWYPHKPFRHHIPYRKL